MGRERVTIGKRFRCGGLCDLGGLPFRFLQDSTGRYSHRDFEKGVVIGDDVFINSLVSVHCGSEGPTVIGDNCILDSHVHISHDVRLGRSVQIGAGAVLLGHVTVGDHSKIFAGAVINPRVRIGKNVIVGANSYVRHDVADGQVVYGSPAARVNHRLTYPHRLF